MTNFRFMVNATEFITPGLIDMLIKRMGARSSLYDALCNAALKLHLNDNRLSVMNELYVKLNVYENPETEYVVEYFVQALVDKMADAIKTIFHSAGFEESAEFFQTTQLKFSTHVWLNKVYFVFETIIV